MEKHGFWISKDQYLNITGSKHIQEIIKTPELYGLTSALAQSVYKKYDEKFGLEGKAREELIKTATLNGWIRVRQYLRPDYWSIQFDIWEARKAIVLEFIGWAIAEQFMYPADEAVLIGFSDGTRIHEQYIHGGVSNLFEKYGCSSVLQARGGCIR